MASAIDIRVETVADRQAIYDVTVDAFTNCEFGHNGEAELIDVLRDRCRDVLSLVACAQDEVVGHVLFSPTKIIAAETEVHGMGLAPMSVRPSHQKRGIGSALVRTGLEQLTAKQCPFVVVLGHPDYYPRFGFKPAANYGISHGFFGIPQDVFFINELHPSSLEGQHGGVAHYPPEFGPQSG